MSAKNDFYQRVHGGRPDYSGSAYDLKDLMSTRPFVPPLRSFCLALDMPLYLFTQTVAGFELPMTGWF